MLDLAASDIDALEASIAADSLADYTPMAWPVIEPATHFRSNWHIDAINEHLEAVTDGGLRRLIINIPPRHMKSTSVGVMWPTWTWLRHPHVRFLFASYAQTLVKRDSVKCRRIIESKGGRLEDGTLVERVGYQGLLRLLGATWNLAEDQNEKLRFENTEAGYRLSTSVDGSATGEGGDIIVIDDPHKADEVDTVTGLQRQNVLDWMDGTMSSRLNDPKTGRVVLVMQRLHQVDLTGHLLEQGGWTHLCLPAEYEPKHPFVWPDDPRTEPGELLWPEHFGRDEIDDLKHKMGSYRAAGQLQQRPAPAEGGILKTRWWKYFDKDLLDEEAFYGRFSRVWQSWDTALKEKTTSDYTVGLLIGQDLAQRYVLRRWRGRVGLTDMTTAVKDMAAWAKERMPRHASHSIYVENAALGPELMAALRRDVQGVVPIDADRDKVSRAYAISPQLEAGNVMVPGASLPDLSGPDPTLTPAWVQELVTECSSFPNAANDDQVDALTQALDPRRTQQPGSKAKEQKTRTISSGLRAGGV